MHLIFLISVMAFVCELMDSSLGMGYGTTLTPLLLAMGYQPIEVVPAVLFSEFATGILAGAFHHEFGNVDLRPGSRDCKVAVVMTGFSVVGVIVAVFIAIQMPAWMVKLYIGILVLVIGLVILKNHRREASFSWWRLSTMGLVAAFNKGISGGGYGPVVTGGQILSGIRGRSAVGIASMAEGITSAVGALIYLTSGVSIPGELTLSLLLGAVLSVPVAAYVVSRVPAERLTLVIGGASTTLGGYTLLRVLL